MDNEKIINRMIRELELAKANPNAMHRHIANAQVLGSLFLEEETVETATPRSITEEEKKMMFGNLPRKKTDPIDDNDDANGESIFDF